VIGLTGNIACGKSLVLRELATRGAETIDADQVAREVTEPGSPVLAAIVQEFGTGILQPDGSLDRRALGAIVFRDPRRSAGWRRSPIRRSWPRSAGAWPRASGRSSSSTRSSCSNRVSPATATRSGW